MSTSTAAEDWFALYPELLEILLQGKTTGGHIIFACDDYLGWGCSFEDEITPSLLNRRELEIKPRALKDKKRQAASTKKLAEVFTPAWVCNIQNNVIDEAWFGRAEVFNQRLDKEGRSWRSTPGRIKFPAGLTWQDYVLSNRLEITCGEAPYLTSRYDAVSAEPIELHQRIGFLDRKLRVVDENVNSEQEWLIWALHALESTYGFEWQCDNLLIARENLLLSFIDYLQDALGRQPTHTELTAAAERIAWNVWQMDGLTKAVPCRLNLTADQKVKLTLADLLKLKAVPCLVFDWKAGHPVLFADIKAGSESDADCTQ
ncbi:MAG: restriction endonuclease subunit M [Proteobacteria bacterium]|uniref:Restriction endonuclease subunit M n=1 Tax=Candidatus Avisuccinivibrio stercorigallinarum TaxID=2840704 RepID=A0A9D9D9R3_9GAMM|nr:restriction endonuclease subunit M [Candidatus Avisuccinivibrio stercorigallinarum]